MSKGHGRIQRLVLDELAEAALNPSHSWVAVREIGGRNRSAKQSIRRAMRSLAEQGYIELFYQPLQDDETSERIRTHLCARITEEGLQYMVGHGE